MTLNAEPDWSSTKSSGARFHEHDSLLIASSTIAREKRERDFRLGERGIESPASRQLLTIALLILDALLCVTNLLHFRGISSPRYRARFARSAFSSSDIRLSVLTSCIRSILDPTARDRGPSFRRRNSLARSRASRCAGSNSVTDLTWDAPVANPTCWRSVLCPESERVWSGRSAYLFAFDQSQIRRPASRSIRLNRVRGGRSAGNIMSIRWGGFRRTVGDIGAHEQDCPTRCR